MKLNKKLLFSILGLGLVVGCTAPFLVSCSSAPSPIQEYYATIDGKEVKVGGTFSIQPGIEIGGETFTSSPGFDSKNLNKQKATAFFDVIGAFVTWLYGAGNSISMLISRSPTTKNNVNPINNASISQNGLDYALASYLNAGNSTYRVGLKKVNATLDLQNSIDTNFKQFVEPIAANKSSLVEVTDPKNPEGSKPTNIALVASNVSLTFSWWRSENPPKISWISSQENLDKQYNHDFMLNAPNGVKPIFEYTLNLNDINFEVNQYSLTTIDGTQYWYPNGTWRIVEKNHTPFAFGKDWAKTNELFTKIDEANKIAAGDVTNENFVNFIKTNGKDINANLSLVIK